MNTKVITRDEVLDDYQDMLKTESHHGHKIILDSDGTYKWEATPWVRKFTDECNLNDIVRGFYSNGKGKNNESWRELYRHMGVSLNMYWETFYWEVNNPLASLYKPPTS